MMEMFEKWQKKRMIKTIGYLDNLSAFKAGEKEGWRAALEWAKNKAIADDYGYSIGLEHIDKELEN